MSTWFLFLILSGRGGVGKSLLASLLMTALTVRGRTPRIIEADQQQRLQLAFPDRVQHIDIDQLPALESDPLALAKAFATLPQVSREAASVPGTDVILDAAAGWDKPVVRYLAESKLLPKLQAINGHAVFLLPMTSDSDSILLAIETARHVEALLPGAQIVFVLNEYPHTVRFDLPGLKGRQQEIRELLSAHRRIKLPSCHERVWGPFERAGMSVMDVSTADPADLAKIASADIDTADVMKGRVERWMNDVLRELTPILDFRENGEKKSKK